LLLVIVLLAAGIGLFFLFRTARGGSNYSKSGNWADFDPGTDANKVGDSRYPHAGIDNYEKEKFLSGLFEDGKE